ncbi:MAG: PQQ-dependent sugar dehydrogenase [Solirubrobacterales bacterium]
MDGGDRAGSGRPWGALLVLVALGAVLIGVLLVTGDDQLSKPAGPKKLSLERIGEFDSPVHVSSDPGDPDRIFVVEQGGLVKLVEDGRESNFLDLTSEVTSGGEQGLLSIAFAPDFAESGHLYVYYTGADSGNVHIDELTADGDSADPATRRELVTVDHSQYANHNGGQLQFGPDGYLYAGIGDGGGGGDPFGSGQDTGSLLGKIIRIDPEPSGAAPYSIPADNPFAEGGGAAEVWSFGLRNPYRFSFDRKTGDLVIGDVGQDNWEEVDFAPAADDGGRGANFGWSCREGPDEFNPAECDGGELTEPVHSYPLDDENCSVTGGYVVRDPSLTELEGRYVYADYCAGELRSLELGARGATGDRAEGVSVPSPSSFGEDACGRIYVASLDGPVFRLSAGREEDLDSCP